MAAAKPQRVSTRATGVVGVAPRQQSRNPDCGFHERGHVDRNHLRAAAHSFDDVVELVARKNGDHDSAHPHHVAVHLARLARRVGDGNAQCETRLRRAGDGLEFF